MSDKSATPLLALQGVGKNFSQAPDTAARIARLLGAGTAAPVVHAVDNVSLELSAGEVLGLVGESGCGKSTLGRMAVGLHSLSSGRRLWKNQDIDQLQGAQQRAQRLAMQMIFQDPYASLNPRLRVQDIVGEAPVAHGMIPSSQQKEYVASLLERVGLDGAMLRRFPHQFSGGQRARVGIARALAVNPALLVCDEAVAALDVSIQAQVLNLFIRLRDELNLTYLFISHDLGVVRHVSDRVAVMYLGRIVETAPSEEIFSRANHPYTQALLAAVPRLESRKIDFVPAGGEIPSPLAPPPGCHFHPRCPYAMERCRVERPELKEVAAAHFSACHLNDSKQ